ncbi:hypothetical protein NHH88_04660 [Oxalobacteraceae bacterium OTU3CAMAD1]|jgi:hypothetical protein|nr:hypothetical protein NHH88_04660 [Oxalobacteraceae bacterium OTU3CAMAD1]
MSYFNWVNLQYMGDVELDFKVLESALKSYLDENGIHQNALKDLATLLEDHAATFTLYTSMIEEMLLLASRSQPDAVFGVQGRGEELRDVWLREYGGGEITFSQGPFHYD